MEITKTKNFRIILFASATVLFMNAIVGGQQFISDNTSNLLASTIELIVRVSGCVIAYLFYRYFRQDPDNLQVTLTKFIFICEVCLTFSLVFHWIEILAFLSIEGIISVLVSVARIIWFCSLFFKENNDSDSFKAVKRFATFSLLAVFCSLAISFNLLNSTDVYGNVAAGNTLMYWIPQLVLAAPYLVLFKFILTYRPEIESERVSN